MPPAPWDRVVWQPEIFRAANGDQPGHLDGHGAGAPVWTRAEKFLHHYEQPRVRSCEEVFQGGGRRTATGVRPFTSDIGPAEIEAHADAGGGS